MVDTLSGHPPPRAGIEPVTDKGFPGIPTKFTAIVTAIGNRQSAIGAQGEIEKHLEIRMDQGFVVFISSEPTMV